MEIGNQTEVFALLKDTRRSPETKYPKGVWLKNTS